MAIFRWGREMTEQELYNEYRKSDYKSFTDFLINKITELKEKYVKECEDVMYVVTNYNKQLTKAKEIIKKLKALFSFPIVTEDDIKRQDEILTEAEQFLNSEVQK